MDNQVRVAGIKCDNKACDYKDDSVRYEDYKEYVNKPCPKCGHNLLTKKDYFITKFLVKLVGRGKVQHEPLQTTGNEKIVSVKLDGTGKIKMENK